MLDYEIEVAAVIGRQGRDISARSALNHVYGYTIMNDYTARDVAEEDKEQGNFLYKGKNMDGLGALGPYITTAAEIGRLDELSLTLKVNGEVRQKAKLREMMFTFAELIVTFSSGITLYPGDLVSSGTPPGVAASRGDSSFFLKPGDTVEAEVTSLGQLRNTITSSR
jgi:2-keto-4-pentenoate hydratase/2-oxohepta-3-ene-1,7-dioic acid hydratase in catechol pathway